MKISAVVITKNEEEMIEGCLRSLSWVDEIVVIDSFSEDKTIEICSKFTKKIYQIKFKDFTSQKNTGINKASGDLILVIDADERVSLSLRDEIKQILSNKIYYSAFEIPFHNYFLGKKMNYGGWNPEYHCRLFKKGEAFYKTDLPIHEKVKIKGKIGVLNSYIYHLSHRNIASNLLKTQERALLESDYLFIKNAPKVTGINLFFGLLRHFFERYVRAKGYKDGMEGLIEALYQTFSQKMIIQGMLWEKQRGKTSEKIYKEIDKMILKGERL